MENIIVVLAGKNPGMSAQWLFDYINRHRIELIELGVVGDIPKPRAIYNVLKRNGNPRKIERVKNNKLDHPWSLGAKVDIPSEMAGEILYIQNILREYDRYLTIRCVQWMVRLGPFIKPILEQRYPNETAENGLRLMQIASIYNRREQVAEISKPAMLETRDLDNRFIYEQDISFESYLHEWTSTFLDSILTLEKNLSENEKLTTEERDKILGKSSKKQISLFYQWIYLKLSNRGDEVFLREHPEIRSLVDKWTVMNTRRGIAKWFDYIRIFYERESETK